MPSRGGNPGNRAPAAQGGTGGPPIIPPPHRSGVIIQGPGLPPIIRAKAAPPSQQPHNFSPAPSSRGHYLPPSHGRAQVYIPPPSVSRAQNAQNQQAAARERASLGALSHLLHESHSLSEHIQTTGPRLSLATATYLIPGYGQLKALSHVPGLIGRGAKDVVNLPVDTLRGAEAVGGALAHDIGSGNLPFFADSKPGGALGGPTDSGSQVTHLLNESWKQSITGHLLNGDVAGAVKTFSQHPVYGAAELSGLYGLVGRGAGAVARTGLVGSKAAEAASPLRAAREVAPGLPPVERVGSKNLITRQAQRVIDQHRAVQLPPKAAERMLRKRVNEFKPVADATKAQEKQQVAQQLRAAMPQTTRKVGPFKLTRVTNANKASGDVSVLAAMTAARSQADVLATVTRHLEQLRAEAGGLKGADLKTNLTHQGHYEQFLSHPDVQAVRTAVAPYAERQAQLELSKHELGLTAPDRRVLLGYAHAEMPNVHYEAKGIPSSNVEALKAARADVKTAQSKLADARVQREKTRVPRDVESALKQAQLKLESRTGFEKGFSSVTGVRAGGVRLDKMAGDVRSLKDALKTERIQRSQEGQAAISAARADLKEARSRKATLERLPKSDMVIKGHVITDPNGAVRPVTGQDILQHIEGAGRNPNDLTYVRMTRPNANAQAIFGRKAMSRGGTSKKFTGATVRQGTYTPGYGAMARSQLGDVSMVNDARSFDRLVREGSLHDPQGKLQTFGPHNWEQFAQQYHEQHGIELVPMRRYAGKPNPEQLSAINQAQSPELAHDMANKMIIGNRKLIADENGNIVGNVKDHEIVLVPRATVDQWEQHVGAGPSKLPRVQQAVQLANRQFRNTVLPFSTKWVMGNFAEATLRAALAGARPTDYRLVNKVIERQHELGLDEGANRLEKSAMGGLHYTMQHRIDMEQIGAFDTKPANSIRGATSKIIGGNNKVVQAIFAGNRKFESGVEKNVLGKHMRDQWHAMAGSWTKAIGAQNRYLDKLAHGYADLPLAEHAARYVRDTLGQYDSFSPGMKWFINTVAPFSPWYFNAARFVYFTLPIEHPVTQAVLLAAAKASPGHVNSVPHGTFFGMPTGGLVPAVPSGTNKYTDLGRYTPMGAFTNGPIDYAVSMILPQVQGAYNAVLGKDPFGRDLQGPNGKKVTDTGQQGLIALNQILGGFLGPVNQLHRIIGEHGATPYNTSTLWNTQTKPGTEHHGGGLFGGLARVLNPLEPTDLGGYQNKKGKGGGGGGSFFKGGGGGGSFFGTMPGTIAHGVDTLAMKSSTSEIAGLYQTLAARVNALKHAGLMAKTATIPPIVIDKKKVSDGAYVTVSSGNHRVMHFPPGFAKILADPKHPYHAWAQAVIVHELAHTQQNRAALASKEMVEGSAQAYEQLAGPQVIPHYTNVGSGNYTNYVASVFGREPYDWVSRRQFTPGAYAPTINFPIGRDFTNLARAGAKIGGGFGAIGLRVAPRVNEAGTIKGRGKI